MWALWISLGSLALAITLLVWQKADHEGDREMLEEIMGQNPMTAPRPPRPPNPMEMEIRDARHRWYTHHAGHPRYLYVTLDGRTQLDVMAWERENYVLVHETPDPNIPFVMTYMGMTVRVLGDAQLALQASDWDIRCWCSNEEIREWQETELEPG